jgi:hypothetical protein
MKISIDQTLALLRSDQPISLTIVRSSGSIGTFKHIAKCTAGHTYKQARTNIQRASIPHISIKKHTLQGTIPIIDLDKDQQLTILISHICYCNGVKVIH